MTDEAKPKRISAHWFLILIFVVPLFLLVGREYARGGLIGSMRLADVGDLLILSPLYVIILLFLWSYMVKYEAPQRLLVTFLAFGFLFIYGQAMHLTGNSINTYITEVNDYRPLIPDDAYALIFDLDERLSHWILLAGATGLIATWFIFDRAKLCPPLFPSNKILLFSIGIVYGILKAFSIIEARMVILVIPTVVVLGWIWLRYWRRSDMSFWQFANDRPFTLFVLILVVVNLSFMVIWGLVFGGFPQPSEIGL